MVIEPAHDHANPLGHVADLQGAMLLGIIYQLVQSSVSMSAISGRTAEASATRGLIYMAVCTVQVIAYGFAVGRASRLLEHVERPSSIAFTRRVLWFAGSGMIVSTWIVQVALYRTWPATPAASLSIVAVTFKLSLPLPVLTIAALAQTLGIAALWNLFLSRYGRIKLVFGDPNGQDRRVFWREYRIREREELRKKRLQRLGPQSSTGEPSA